MSAGLAALLAGYVAGRLSGWWTPDRSRAVAAGVYRRFLAATQRRR